MGAWIEIHEDSANLPTLKSHPTMGAWIEIQVSESPRRYEPGRTPRWVRGLKYCLLALNTAMTGRTPRWVRGLKFKSMQTDDGVSVVAPHDGCVD